ncbi:hypothetical protein VTI28DRAFT_8089 [Corynascus sepedonium]
MPSDVTESIELKGDHDQRETSTGLRSIGSDMMAASRAWLAPALGSGLMRALIPWSFQSGSGPGKLRPTAYLDGLRGFAAFLVYWHHHELWAHVAPQITAFESSFGFNGRHYFAAFPGVRIFLHGGHFAVAAFFVISGYVLSAKPLSLIHAGDQVKLADNLASALFRRWFRLFIPIICTTFVYMTLFQASGVWVDGLEAKPSYLRAVSSWYTEVMKFSFIFHSDKASLLSYNFHLWSIPVEFRGSIVIYTTLLALSRCTRNARLWCEAGLVFYFLYVVDGWYCALFMSGMLLNDLEQLAAKDELPSFLDRFRPHKTAIFYTLLAASIYLGGCPAHTGEVEDLRRNPGWYLLSFLKPPAVSDAKWFYLFWAAVFLVASVPHIRWLRRFFETRFCQYLGRISYSLYLIHGPILFTLGNHLYAATGWPNSLRLYHLPDWFNLFPLPMSGPMGFEIAFLVPNLVLLPLTLYLAEVVTTLFDEPSVRLPQWLYKTASSSRPTRLPA